MAGRFSLSFPGRRDQDDPWFRVGTLDVTTSVLVPALCVLSMFAWAVSPSLLDPLVLRADSVWRGQAWRLVTWPLANTPGVWTVLTLAMLWFFGRELERVVGRTRYATMLILLALVPGVVAAAVGIDMAGARPVEIAVFCVFCAQFPEVRFWGSIPAWVFALVIVGVEVLFAAGTRDSGALLVLAASLVTAALTARRYGLLEAYAFIPRLGGGGSGSRQRTAGKGRRREGLARGRRTDASVVQGPWQPPGLSPLEQAELDSLLDKTNATGLDSLSRAEKARLNELSKKLRSR